MTDRSRALGRRTGLLLAGAAGAAALLATALLVPGPVVVATPQSVEVTPVRAAQQLVCGGPVLGLSRGENPELIAVGEPDRRVAGRYLPRVERRRRADERRRDRHRTALPCGLPRRRLVGLAHHRQRRPRCFGGHHHRGQHVVEPPDHFVHRGTLGGVSRRAGLHQLGEPSRRLGVNADVDARRLDLPLAMEL